MKLPRTPGEIPECFAEAWNNGEASALAALFAEDADFVNVVGLWWYTRADIECAHEYGLRTFFKDSTLVMGRTEVRPLGDTAAIVHVRWRLTGQRDKQGNVLEDRFTILIFIAERIDDVWLVMAAQNTDVVPGMETHAASGERLEATDYRDQK